MFFVAVLSVAVQGTTVDKAARLLGVLDPNPAPRRFPLRYDTTVLPDKQLVEFEVAPDSEAENKRIVDLNLPRGVLVLLIGRDDESVVPNGGTILRRGDVIQLLADAKFVARGREMFRTPSGSS